jgi:small subunit ribosomal protein S2
MNPDDVKTIDRDLKLNGRIDRDGWVNQARALLAA